MEGGAISGHMEVDYHAMFKQKSEIQIKEYFESK
jgi:hypothetical protein